MGWHWGLCNQLRDPDHIRWLAVSPSNTPPWHGKSHDMSHMTLFKLSKQGSTAIVPRAHMSKLKRSELRSRYGVTWSRCGFNLCVAPSYGNWGVLVFRRVRMRGCPEWGTERMGKLRLGAEGLQRVWFGILVDYKLKSNFLSLPAYIRKGNRDVRWSG